MVDTITPISHGILDDNSKIPKNYAELVLKRIEWYYREKNDKDFRKNKEHSKNEYSYFFDPAISKFDLLGFHLACQAIAYKYNLGSRETKLFLESQERVIEERLSKLDLEIREELDDEILNELLDDLVGLKWTDILPLIASKKISLKDLLLKKGEIVLDEDEFQEEFYEETKEWPQRRIEKVFNILVGYSTKELILTQKIIENSENYLKNIKERLEIIEIHPNIEKLAEEIAQLLDELNNKYSALYGEGGIFARDNEISKLNKDAFPPCANKTIEGVKSGNRNDAIVLFLTSFISYARLNPQVFRLDQSIKVSDVDPDLKITLNEILPIIDEAAGNAVPPLFEDQPQERINIVSKLGFGMHDEVKIENEGQTKWYTPMSCDKIKLHLSPLCKPDKICKKIGNPLSYYSYRKWQMKNEGKGETPAKTTSKDENTE